MTRSTPIDCNNFDLTKSSTTIGTPRARTSTNHINNFTTRQDGALRPPSFRLAAPRSRSSAFLQRHLQHQCVLRAGWRFFTPLFNMTLESASISFRLGDIAFSFENGSLSAFSLPVSVPVSAAAPFTTPPLTTTPPLSLSSSVTEKAKNTREANHLAFEAECVAATDRRKKFVSKPSPKQC